MFNIGDEVIAKKKYEGNSAGWEGVIVNATEAAQILSHSQNPAIYRGLEEVVFGMMKKGDIFVKSEVKSVFRPGETFIDVRYFKESELVHKIITKEYDPSQNGDTDEDV
jgi:hypothetical protein